MAFTSSAKRVANRLLAPLGVRLDSLTMEHAESDRLRALEARGQFDRQVFPLLPQFQTCDPSPVFQQIATDRIRFAALVDERSEAPFPLENSYFTTPDADVLYSIVQMYRPEKIVEVGSGNSTHLFFLAVREAALVTQIVSIDPFPRRDVDAFSDRVIRQRLEDVSDPSVFSELKPNDILFIDSSHEVKVGNDVVQLLLKTIPAIARGVLVHVHDIFLPYEYPREWLVRERWPWAEQYMVQALLQGSTEFEVLWPGYYLEKTRPDFTSHFQFWRGASARSLWLRRA